MVAAGVGTHLAATPFADAPMPITLFHIIALTMNIALVYTTGRSEYRPAAPGTAQTATNRFGGGDGMLAASHHRTFCGQ